MSTLPAALVLVVSLLYLGLLFVIALVVDRRAAAGRSLIASPTVYALSLAVYCTSWTFYGTVTQAQRSGWPVPPTFIGTIILYVLGFGVLLRLHRIAREQNSTSLADLVATRLGKHSGLAALITFVAVLGILPYIALQLKAVAMSYGLLTRASDLSPPPWQDSALYVALLYLAIQQVEGMIIVPLVHQHQALTGRRVMHRADMGAEVPLHRDQEGKIDRLACTALAGAPHPNTIRGYLARQWTPAAIPQLEAQVKAGNLRVLAVFTDARVPELPDVPTLKEMGAAEVFLPGTVIAHDLLLQFQDDLKAVQDWKLSGTHYQRTAEPDEGHEWLPPKPDLPAAVADWFAELGTRHERLPV